VKVAVVLFNLGGPDAPEAVRPFLFNLFNDPAIIRAPGIIRTLIARSISRSREASARLNYDRMGGRSPILPETQDQARALEKRLADTAAEVRVFVAMRYWDPVTEDVAKDVAAYAPDEIVLLPLYPQFSTTTTASSLKAWNGAYRGSGRARAVCCYSQADAFIAAHAKLIEDAWIKADRPKPVRLLFSAHGLPQKIIDAGDPYQAQVEATAKATAERLGGGWDWTVCYQSRVGPLKWIGPSTLEEIERASKEGVGVVVCPIAFVSEHVETLVELDHDYAEAAKAMGCAPYVRVPALGVEAGFIETLAGAVEAALERPRGVETLAGGRWCPSKFSGCPAERAHA
jgi:ferrochelatase